MIKAFQNGLFLTVIFFLFVSASFQEDENNASIKFDKLIHDFGVLEYNARTKYNFTFENTGKSNLIIFDCLASSGSAIASSRREPILPGEKGVVEVVYDTKRQGTFNSEILVISNAKNQEKISLRIKGKVNIKPSEE